MSLSASQGGKEELYHRGGRRLGIAALLAAVLLLGGSATQAANPAPASSAAPASPARGRDHAVITGKLTTSGQSQARQVAESNHVTVVELSGNYDQSLPSGADNLDPRLAVAREFYRTHPDDYDFLFVFSSFEFQASDAAGVAASAFHFAIQNRVQGLGLPIFDHTADFGSAGRLQGYVDMAALSRRVTDPLLPGFDSTLSVAAHEMLHQWAAHVHFKQADGTLSDALLGRDGAHWSFLLDSDASVLYGEKWQNNGNGSFTTTGLFKFYSPLDLYLAGFLAPEEVPPFLLIDNPAIDRTRLPELGVTVAGTARTVSVADVIAAEGPRVPAAAAAQHDFRAAMVYLVRPGETPVAADIEALDRIRQALATRFAVLTGGRGTLAIYPQALPGQTGGTPPPVDGGGLRPGAANLTDALAWLRGRQGSDGAWFDTTSTRPRDTAVVYSTLAALDPSFTTQGRSAALAWMSGQSPGNTDDLARLIQARAAAGTSLLGLQNPDGGWGLAPGFGSEPLDTALAALTLAGTGGTGPVPEALNRAAAYLLATQGSDGGWSNVAGGASRTGATALTLQALKRLGREGTVAPRGLAFLAGKQNADGGFGDSPSNAHDTAAAVQAAIDLGGAGALRLGDAAAYLGSHQSIAGSWEGSTYTTASVVSALRRFSFPNWRFSGPASALPAQPRDSEKVEIDVTVSNDGNASAPAGVLRIYDGDPAAGGVASGPDIPLPPLAAGQSSAVRTPWDTSGKAGNHTLFLVLDPDRQVEELSRADDVTALAVTVDPAAVAADLELRDGDIAVSPAHPTTLPAQLAISATVRNIGQTAVPAVKVRLYRGSAQSGTAVGEVTVAVPGRSSAAANFLYTLTTPGNTVLTVVADPDHQVSEADETNNAGTATVMTTVAIDLAVAPADLSVSGTAFVGSDLTFHVTLHNNGTVDAPAALVRYTVSDGTTIRTLPDGNVLLGAGQSAAESVVWRVDLTGNLTFTVELDPQGRIQESDRTNDRAALAFTTTAVTVPNLVIGRGDLTIAPNPGLEGKLATLTVVVHNTGGQAIANVPVGFYDGDPAQGAPLLGALQVIPALAAGGSVTVSLPVARLGGGTSRLLYAVADPGHTLTELTPGDNATFVVLPVLSLPDAAVSSAALGLTPAFPSPGQPVTLTATVANLGQQGIAGLLVRAYDGDPAGGGVAVGEQTIATLPGISGIPGNGTATVSFTWTLAAGTGGNGQHALFVVVDPGNAVDESSKANNSARLDVSVQQGNSVVSNRYFSPDGDGVQDTTVFAFRLDAPRSVAIEVVDKNGARVRRHAGPELANASGGSFEWDGRDDAGRLVRDGDYRLRAISADGASLGEAVATVDTNRSSLLRALGTPFENRTNLTCALPNVSPLLLTHDEEQAYFYIERQNANPSYPTGIYRMPAGGGDPQAIVPPGWFAGDSPGQLIVAGDGSVLAFGVNGGGHPTLLWVASGNGSTPAPLADSGLLVAFGPGNQSVIVQGDDFSLRAIPIDGSLPRTLFTTANGGNAANTGLQNAGVAVSPEGGRLLVQDLDDAGAVTRTWLVDVTTGTKTRLADGVTGYAWSADGRKAALMEGGRVAIVDSTGAEIRAFDVPTDLPPDVATGQLFPGEDISPHAALPSWSTSGAELSVFVTYGFFCGGGWDRLLVLDLATGATHTAGFTYHEGCRSAHRPKLAAAPTSAADSTSLLRPRGNLLWAPADRALLYTVDRGGSVAIDLDDQDRQIPLLPDLQSFGSQGFSPTGRLLLYGSADAPRDPQSVCYQRAQSDQWSLRSLMNLTADLRPRRSSEVGGVLLEGTAADLHFKRYSLDYANAADPTRWSPIAPPSATPVYDGLFTTWVPPGSGSFLVRLTVEDLAGNRRTAIRRVSSPDTPSVTDLQVSPRYISPNGDGILDAATVHYRVLSPVHLDFRIYGHDNRLVRTISRDHSVIGTTFDLTWDGRDDAGQTVADGEYRFVVQSYQFFVTVDTRPPSAAARLRNAKQCLPLGQKAYVGSAPAVSFDIGDENQLNDASLAEETGVGAAPSSWQPFGDALGGFRTLTLPELVNHQFRVRVADVAGNPAAAVSGLAAEELFVTGFGAHALDPKTGTFQPVAGIECDPGAADPFHLPVLNLFHLAHGTVARFEAVESVRAPLSALFVEYQPVPIVDGHERPDLLDTGTWGSVPVTGFLDPAAPREGLPQGRLRFTWDLHEIQPGVVTAVRLRAVAAGGQHLSDGFEVLTDGLTLERITKSLKSYDDGDPLKDLLLQAGLDPGTQVVLAGQQFFADPVKQITLYAESPDDPRFRVPQTLAPAAIGNGRFLFHSDNWLACKTYRFYAVAVTAPVLDPTTGQTASRTLKSGGVDLKLPCLDVKIGPDVVPGGACGTAGPSHRSLSLQPTSLDGAALQLLTLSGPDGSGQQRLLQSFNQPQSGQIYTYDVDVSGVPAGEYPYFARLTNVNGEEKDALTTLVVEHTAPQLSLTSPLEGQKVCGLHAADGSNFIPVVGTIDDALGGFRYSLGVDRPQPPQLIHTSNSRALHSPVGVVKDASGEVTVTLQVTNAGGFTECAVRHFNFDGLVESPVETAEPTIFSPNGDGNLDTAAVTFAAGEPVNVDVTVYPNAACSPLFPHDCSPIGLPLRHLASGLPLPSGSGRLTWDGLADDGSRVPDGSYAVLVAFTDGCGNVIHTFVTLAVDTTAPQVAITYPHPTDPVTLAVEVTGSIADLHLVGWTLEVGAGQDPSSWLRLGSGQIELPDRFLGTWNTYGLAGDYTLRLVATDLAGNRSETRVALVLASRTELLTYLEAEPRLFSPNGDGKLETTSLRFGLGADEQIDVTILQPDRTPVRHLLTGTALGKGAAIQSWDGTTDGGGPAPDGTYQAEVYARLAANPAVTERQSVSVVLDRTAPTVAIRRPAAGGFVAPTGTVLGTIRDSNLKSFSVSLTSTPQSPVWTALASGTANQVDTALGSLAGLADGAYALKVDALDEGQIQVERILPFTVDSTPPKVTLTAPATGSVLGGISGVVPVAGSVVEEHLKDWQVELGAGANPTAWTTLVSGTTLPLPAPLLAWNVAALADGPYTLRLSAHDQADLFGEAHVALAIDNTPPVAVLSAPADGSYVTGPVAIMGSATDTNLLSYELAVAPGPKGASQQFSVLGGGVNAVANGTLLQWSAFPPDGVATLRLSVLDKAGNRSTAEVQVTVDTHPPAPPLQLAVQVDHRDAHLSWHAGAEPDLAGYRLYRDGVRITLAPVPGSSYVDAGLTEGVYTYTVTAVDRAGLESQRSAPQQARIDTTLPAALLTRPAGGSRVSGLVDVKGTAWSVDDFKEYRLYAVAVDGSAGQQLLRRSPVALQADLLGQWNTLALPEGAAYRLRLEAEDLAGNVAVAEVAVTVDNTPPAAPTGLTATANTPVLSSLQLTWNANPESDLAGYLLYRNGRLANASGTVVGDLAPYLIRGTAYVDAALPDGTFTYQLYAVDTAGNESDPSAPAQATLDNHLPHVTIADPAAGAVFQGALHLLATTPDLDVARVRFQYRPAGGSWTDLGPAVTTVPWETTWNASALPFGPYEVQAIATKTDGRTDPAPAPVAVTRKNLVRPPVPQNVATRVAGGNVALTWSPVAASDLTGYLIDRTPAFGAGGTARLTPAPLAATTFADPGLADDTYSYTVTAVNAAGNESDPGEPAAARVYTLLLDQPYTPTAATATDLTGGNAITPGQLGGQIAGPGGSTPLPGVPSDAAGRFAWSALPLTRGTSLLAVTATDGTGNTSRTSTVHVVSAAPPAQATGAVAIANADLHVALSWNPNPEPPAALAGYRVTRDGVPAPPAAPVDLPLTATASSQSAATTAAGQAIDVNPATAWTPGTGADATYAGQWLALAWREARQVMRIEIDWGTASPGSGAPLADSAFDYDLEGWDGSVWVPLAHRRADSGDSSGKSALDLDRPYRTTQVRLLLLASSHAPRVAEMRVLQLPLVTTPAFSETAPNGHHQYRVIAVGSLGIESAPSDPAGVDVGNVTPPAPVTLSGSAAGPDVHLAWTASAALAPGATLRYDLYRDGVRIAQVLDSGVLAYIDASRPNGTYRYTVRPVDSLGNAAELSNEVAVAVAVVPLPAPTGLTVAAPATGGTLDLAWSAGAGPSPVGYRVLRGTVPGGPYQAVATVGAVTAYRDTGRVDGTRYFYVVAALDGAGNASPFSNEASGTPADTQAPPVPVLHHPVLSSLTLVTGDDTVDLAGSATPGVKVDLTRNGAPAGQTQALATAVSTPAVLPAASLRVPSPDGRYVWNLDFQVSPQASLYDFESGSTSLLPGVFGGTGATGLPSWSADGRSVVLTAGQQVIAYRLAGAVKTTLATLDTVSVAVPAPDGRRIAILGSRAGQGGLWLLDPRDGTWDLLVEVDPAAVDRSRLAWAPDASAIAYVGPLPPPDDGASGLVVVQVAAPHARSRVDSTLGGGRPSWSPDGTALVYTSIASGTEQVRRFHLGDAAPADLTAGPAAHTSPQWSPDGARIAYLAPDGVYLLNADAANAGNTGNTGASPFRIADFQAFDLYWVSGGYLVALADSAALRLAPAGRFGFPAVALDPGDNRFTATARKTDGRLSAPSAARTVRLDVADRPDLAILADDLVLLPAAPLPNQTVRITVTVHNLGAVAAPASGLTLAAAGPGGVTPLTAQGSPLSVPAIAPGGAASVSLELALPLTAGSYTLVATADPQSLVTEVTRTNNQALRAFAVVSQGPPTLAVTTDHAVYPPAGDVIAGIEVWNGNSAFTGRLELAVEDTQGFLVQALPAIPIAGLGYGARLKQTVTWNAGSTFAGGYRFHVRLLDAQGVQQTEAFTAFSISGLVELAGTVATDRASYLPGAVVHVTAHVLYASGNALLSDADVHLQVLDSGGHAAADWVRPLGQLLPGGAGTVAVDWPGAGAGSYRVTLEVRRAGQVAATAATVFDITPVTVAVDGTLVLSDRAPAWGATLNASYRVHNGSAAALAQLPARVRVLDAATGQVLASQAVALDLAAGGTASGAVSFDTRSLGLGNRIALLEADVPPAGGGAAATVRLAVVGLAVADRTPPVVTVVQPAAGSHPGAAFDVVVTAVDALSPIAAVEASLDGGATWMPLTLADPSTGRYSRHVTGVAEGPHTVRARATDAPGNSAQTADVAFVVAVPSLTIQVAGVQDGGLYGAPVVPVITLTDAVPIATSTLSLDGQAFVSGTTVSQEGGHTLVVTAVDQAGTQANLTLAFAIDRTPPTISVTGVTQGGSYNAATTPVVTVTDLHPGSQTVTLDGQSFTSGTAVSQEGDHTLAVTATDQAGNRASLSITFTLDKTAPVISVTGISQGGLYSAAVTPVVTVTELHPGSQTVILDGQSFTSGTAVSQEGDHTLAITATDQAGNRASLSITFTLDKTAPVIAVTGISQGGLYNAAVTPVVTVTELHPGSQTLTLDGQSFTSGTAVTQEGDHTLAVTASDQAGNHASLSIAFTLDKTAPVIAVTGISQGGLYNAAVTPLVTVTELHPGSQTLTLDGQSFTSGTAVSQEGDHTLAVTATDQAGNHASLSITFTLDKTAPVISVTGISQGGLYNAAVTPVVTVTELHPGSQTLTLDGQSFTSGTAVSQEGDHTLAITATDQAGNRASLSVAFTLDKTAPAINVTGVTQSGSYTGSVTPVITVTEIHPGTVSVTLNGQPFTSGTAVSTPGSFQLHVDAADAAGNHGQASVNFTVTSAAGPLVLQKTARLAVDADGGGAVTPGDTLEYTLTLHNGGAPTLTGVTVSDAIPASTTLVAGSVTATSGTVTGTNPVAVTVGNLAATDVTIKFRVTINAVVSAVSNQATATSHELPAVLSDDPATPAPNDATVTPVAGPITVSVADVLVSESETAVVPAVFTVTLSRASNQTITVAYATVDGTALAGVDYTAVSGTLTFAPGVTSKTVAVDVLPDFSSGADETFSLRLSLPTGAVLGRNPGLATVAADPLCPSSNLLVNPGAETAVAYGRLPGWTAVTGTWAQQGASPAPYEGDLYLAPGASSTAELDQDVSVAAWSAAIAAGGQKFAFAGFLQTLVKSPSDTARIIVEYRDAGNQQVLASFNSGALTSAQKWLRIVDVRTAPVGTGWIRVRLLGSRAGSAGGIGAFFDALELHSLGQPALSIESVGVRRPAAGQTALAQPRVTLSCPATQAVAVSYATADGSAVAGLDYLSANGTLTFAPGETVKPVQMVILGRTGASDGSDGPPDTAFTVRLSSASSAVLAGNLGSQGRVTVLANPFCARPPSYWKLRQASWPVTSLNLGGVLYTGDRLLVLLRSTSTSDALLLLARNLAATRLSLAAGAPEGSIATVADPADALLAQHQSGAVAPGSDDTQVRSLAAQLDAYNSAPCATDRACHTLPLGTAGGFNLFVLGKDTQSGTDTQGRVAVGGDAKLTSYSLGDLLSGSGTNDVLVAGGSLTFQGGTAHHGNVVYGTTANVTGFTVPDGTVHQGHPIDFTVESRNLGALAELWAALPANGTTTVTPYHQINLVGTDPKWNVFQLAGSDLAAASGFSIQAPQGSAVVIDIDEASDSLQNFGFQLSGVTANNVIYNFFAATSLMMQSIGVQGTVVAPHAAVTFNNGNINGGLVAGSLTGGGQVNLKSFAGCLPVTAAPVVQDGAH